MADAITWQFQIDDGVSAPANRMEAALGKFESSVRSQDAQLQVLGAQVNFLGHAMSALASDLRGLPAAFNAVGAGSRAAARDVQALASAESQAVHSGDELRRSFDSLVRSYQQLGMSKAEAMKAAYSQSEPITLGEHGPVQEIQQVTESLGEASEATGKLSESFGGLMEAAVVFEALKTGMEAFVSGAERGYEITKKVVEGASFQQTMLMSLGIQLGSRERGQSFWNELNQIERVVPFGVQDVTSAAQLLLPQLKTGGTKQALLALSDLVLPGQGTLEQSAQELMFALAGGKLTKQELRVLGHQTGGKLGLDSIKQALMRTRGYSEARADAVFAHHGGISGYDAVALMEDIAREQSGGVIGGAARQHATESWAGVASTLKSNIDRLFYGIDLGPLTKFVNGINDLLGGEVGDALSAEIGQDFKDLFNSIFGEYLGPEGGERLKNEIHDFGSSVIAASKALVTLTGWMVKLAEVIGGLVHPGEQHYSEKGRHAEIQGNVPTLEDVATGEMDLNGDFYAHRRRTDAEALSAGLVTQFSLGLFGTHRGGLTGNAGIQAFEDALKHPEKYGLQQGSNIRPFTMLLKDTDQKTIKAAHDEVAKFEREHPLLKNLIRIADVSGKTYEGLAPGATIQITQVFQGNTDPKAAGQAAHDGVSRGIEKLGNQTRGR